MLVHVDRLALLPSVRAALVCNLSYWFDRDDASRSAFASAAARAKRPDAQCFTALAERVRLDRSAIAHSVARTASRTQPSPIWHVEGADLYVPKRLQPQVTALCDAGDVAVSNAMQDHGAGFRARTLTHRRCAVRLAAANACACDRRGARRHDGVVAGDE